MAQIVLSPEGVRLIDDEGESVQVLDLGIVKQLVVSDPQNNELLNEILGELKRLTVMIAEATEETGD